MLIKNWEFDFTSANSQELVLEENAVIETILVDSADVNFKVDTYLITPKNIEYPYYSYGMSNEVNLCLVLGTKIKFISNGIGKVMLLGRYF